MSAAAVAVAAASVLATAVAPTVNDLLANAISKIVGEIVTRLAGRIPDAWDLVGLAVQLIEQPIDGIKKLSGVEKSGAVKEIVSQSIRKLAVPASSKEALQKSLTKLEALIESTLVLIEVNEKLIASTGCCSAPPALTPLPFDLLNRSE